MTLIFLKDKKTYLYVLLVLLVFGFSFLGFLIPQINLICFWLIVLAALFLTFWRLEIGVLLAVLELIVGSKGYLFSFPLFGYVVSLRIALFLIILLAYFYKILKKKEIKFFHSNLWLPFLIFAAFLLFGLVNGLIRNPGTIVFYDLNAYFYFALIFPFFAVFSQKENVLKLVKVMTIGALSVAFFTFFILLDFGLFEYSPSLVSATKVESKQLEELENISALPENARLAQTTKIAREKLSLDSSDLTGEKPALYRWLRDLGLAEVSYMGGRFFRVFSPSQFYAVIFLLFLITCIFWAKNEFREKIPLLIFIFLFGLVFLISFSRSFWLGFGVALAYLIFSLPRKKFLKTVFFFLLAILLILILLFLAAPPVFELFINRLASFLNPASELAASNRVNMLGPIWEKIKENPFFGSGFGTLIAFKSLIPGTDLVEYIKVYLYEWAYLDIWVKIGGFGLLSYLYLIYFIFKSGHYALKRNKEPADNYILIKALLAGLIFLLVTHLTTPFLNHPLGIGYLLITSSLFYLYLTRKNEPEKSHP